VDDGVEKHKQRGYPCDSGQRVVDLIGWLERGEQRENEDKESVGGQDEGACGEPPPLLFHFLYLFYALRSHRDGRPPDSSGFAHEDKVAKPGEEDEGDLEDNVEEKVLAKAQTQSDAVEVPDVAIAAEGVVAIDKGERAEIVDCHRTIVLQQVTHEEDCLRNLHRLQSDQLVENHRGG
jgi:hypothetical protein